MIPFVWLLLIIGVAVVILIGALSWFMFRNMWFDSDFVRGIRFYPDSPTVIDIVYIGKDLFSKLAKRGSQTPYSTSAGNVIFVIEDITDTEIVFSWIHEASSLEFVSKKKSFDFLGSLTSRYMLAYNRIRDIPYSLGLYFANHAITAFEDDRTKHIVTLDPTDPEISKIMADLRSALDPLEETRKEFSKPDNKSPEPPPGDDKPSEVVLVV